MSQVLVVPDVYSTIQAAINAAKSWDTIFIQPGTYAGFNYTKPVHLKGNTDDPINNRVQINSLDIGWVDAPFIILNGAYTWPGTMHFEGLYLNGTDALFGYQTGTVWMYGNPVFDFNRCYLRASSGRYYLGPVSYYINEPITINLVNCTMADSVSYLINSNSYPHATVNRSATWQKNDPPLGNGIQIGYANDYTYGGSAPPAGYGCQNGAFYFDQWGPGGRIFQIKGRCRLNGNPYRATLRLLATTPAWVTVAQTESDPITGEYSFGYLSPYNEYYVVAEIPGERPQLHGPIIPQP